MSFANFLHGVSPFGPIFAKELRTTSRRKRTYFIRVVYVALLLAGMGLIYTLFASMSRRGGGIAARNQQQAFLGQFFFMFYAIFSVWIMGILGPILTATAISSERLHKTLSVLLMTPITAWQIVAGKLFSRLLIALTLIGLGLPVLALVRLLGGVELDRMLGVVALAVAASISSAAIGLLFSTLLNRAYAVILLSFATMLLLYAFVPFAVFLTLHAAVGGSRAETLASEITLSLHPYAFVCAASSPDFVRMSMMLHWNWCIGSHLALAALLLMLSAAILRRRARREGEASRGTLAANLVIAPAPPPPLLSTTDAAPMAAAAPVLSYAPPGLKKKPPRTRHVADNAILWREIRRPLMARRWQRITGAGLCVALLLFVYAMLGYNKDLGDADAHKVWACVFNFIFAGLVNILASTAIAQEKESDTWTLLLATPVSGQTIVWGKAIGVMRRLLFPILLIAGHFLIFAIFQVISFSAAFCGIWIIVTFNTIWAATGVYFSLRFSKVTAAVICNFLLAVCAYLIVLAVLAICTGLFKSRQYGPLSDLNPRFIDAIVSVIFFCGAGWWCVALVLAFLRRRGALGQLMLASICCFTTTFICAARMEWIEAGTLYWQVGWYTPYYFLGGMDWGGSQYRGDLWLPTGVRVTSDLSLVAVVFVAGWAHLLVAAGILRMTGWKFSALVGRAAQLQKL